MIIACDLSMGNVGETIGEARAKCVPNLFSTWIDAYSAANDSSSMLPGVRRSIATGSAAPP